MITDHSPRFKRAFVTGGTGMVGASLCNLLSKRGIKVTAFSRRRGDIELGELVTHVSGDILDRDAVLEAASGADIVFHAAAAVHGSESTYEGFHRMNVSGTENIIYVTETVGARLVHISSVAVDGFTRGRLADPYAQTKAMAEDLVFAAVKRGDEMLVVRPATVFGSERGRSGLVTDRILSGSLKVLPASSRKINPVWVEDLAVALTRAAEVGEIGRVYTVAGPTLSTGVFARSIAEHLGIRPYLVSIPAWLFAIPLQMAWWAKSVTGYTPPVTVEALCSDSVYDGTEAASTLGFSYTPILEIFDRS